jgi:hypothetical protein
MTKVISLVDVLNSFAIMIIDEPGSSVSFEDGFGIVWVTLELE